MPQTMLALLALMAAVTMSLTWQRDSMRAQMNLIEAELQVEARGVVNEVFERVAELAFDENVAPTSPSDLTPETQFGTNRSYTDPGVKDVDDLHQMRPHTIVRTVTNPLNGEPAQIPFIVTAEVDYVDDASGDELKWAGGARTFYKRFTVTVRPDVGMARPERSAVTVSRVYSYSF